MHSQQHQRPLLWIRLLTQWKKTCMPSCIDLLFFVLEIFNGSFSISLCIICPRVSESFNFFFIFQYQHLFMKLFPLIITLVHCHRRKCKRCKKIKLLSHSVISSRRVNHCHYSAIIIFFMMFFALLCQGTRTYTFTCTHGCIHMYTYAHPSTYTQTHHIQTLMHKTHIHTHRHTCTHSWVHCT